MLFHFQRIGANLPTDAQPVEWLGQSRLLFLRGRPLGRWLVAELFGTWEQLWMKVYEVPTQKRNMIEHLNDATYIELNDDIGGEQGMDRLKKGFIDLNSFIRVLHNRKLRGGSASNMKTRLQVLRAINEYEQWFDTGAYEVCKPTASDKKTDGTLVRTPERATGGITHEEQEFIQQTMLWHDAFYRRTKPLDNLETATAVEKFYEAIGIKTPQVVIVANPITAAVAGAFASLLLHKQVQRENALAQSDLERFLLSKSVADILVATAERATKASIDTTTDLSIRSLVNNRPHWYPWRQDTLRTLQLFGWSPDATIADLQLATGQKFETDTIFAAVKQLVPDLKVSHSEFSDDMQLMFALAQDLSGHNVEKQAYLLTHAATDPELEAEVLRHSPEFREFCSGRLSMMADALVPDYYPLESIFGRDCLQLDLPIYKQFSAWEKLSTVCFAAVVHKEFCIVSDFPEELGLDENHRLHLKTSWRDGFATYFWHGTRVPAWLITSPEKITLELIESEVNLELRRIMVTQYGAARYLVESGAVEIHQDRFGILYRSVLDRFESLHMVKVKNSTMEPDGTFKEYFLRVPPDIVTAKAAVAWTFGMSAEEYEPDEES